MVYIKKRLSHLSIFLVKCDKVNLEFDLFISQVSMAALFFVVIFHFIQLWTLLLLSILHVFYSGHKLAGVVISLLTAICLCSQVL